MKPVRVALLALAVVAVSACGVRAQDGPERLDDSAAVVLPDTGAPQPSAARNAVEVYFIRSDRLVGVVRPVGSADIPTAVGTLLEGPTEAEAASGLRTAVPVGTRLRGVTVEGGTAQIDLSDSFAEVSGENQVPAVAQLVFTVTGMAGVERVTVAVDGTVIDVPRSDGTLTSGPLTRIDFTAVAPS